MFPCHRHHGSGPSSRPGPSGRPDRPDRPGWSSRPGRRGRTCGRTGHALAERTSSSRPALGLLLCLFGLFCVLALPGASSAHPVRRVVDTESRVDANLIEMRTTNVGSFAYDMTRTPPGPGLIYPAGTTRTAVFAAGLWMAARSSGDTCVTVAEHPAMFAPGPIVSPTSWGDGSSALYRVYKINTGDTPGSNPDYEAWLNWPAGTPGGPPLVHGLPRLLGDQTLWSVYNDLNPDHAANDLGTIKPLGVEVRQSTFALVQPPNERTVFLEFEIINRGAGSLENAYVSIWSDPDLGDPGDDLVGCEIPRDMGFCYNSKNQDTVYGATPPAVGMILLQGPIVPSIGVIAWVNGKPIQDYRNLRMTSFQKCIGSAEPTNPAETYNFMRGLNTRGAPMINPTTSQFTNFAVSGDPVRSTGWLDTQPGDRRMMITSGPFDMAPGDSQIVTAAIIIGQGADRLRSITNLRLVADSARVAFARIFPPTTPVLLEVFAARAYAEGVRVSWRLGEMSDRADLFIERDCGGGWMGVNDAPLHGGEGEFLDSAAEPGALCRYRLAAIGASGERIELGETETTVPALDGPVLYVERNPSRGRVTVAWRLPAPGSVRLEAFGPSGRLLRVLHAGAAATGPNETRWDGRDSAGRPVSGMVLLRLTTGAGSRAARTILLR